MAKSPVTYNRILKEFTKINDKQPDERKLPIDVRRKLAKSLADSGELKVKDIKGAILNEYEKKVKPKKPSTYNTILKEFTKINDKLPEERKLSLKERRRIIREELMPEFEEVPKYKIRIKSIKGAIIREYDKIPPKELCDINYLDASDFGFVEWYSLDEAISELVPDCVYVKVSAGEFGETRIFNTRNYEYGRKGVREIVEAIRPEADNNSGRFVFSGYKKLRPRKRNDGTPENYYLDFVLFSVDARGNETAFGNTEQVEYTLPKSRENRNKKAKVNKIIESKIKQLKAKKDSRRRAKKTLEKNIKDLQLLAKKSNKRPTKTNEYQKYKQFNKTAELIEKYKKDAKITDNQYERDLQRILKNLS